MNTIVWNKRYEIGVDFIDKEHKQPFLNHKQIIGAQSGRRQRGMGMPRRR